MKTIEQKHFPFPEEFFKLLDAEKISSAYEDMKTLGFVPYEDNTKGGVFWHLRSSWFVDNLITDEVDCVLYSYDGKMDTLQNVYKRFKDAVAEDDKDSNSMFDLEFAPWGIFQPLYVLQSGYIGNAMCFWKESCSGFTTNVEEAGKFTYDEVMHEHKADCGETIWPCSILNYPIKTVDMQYIPQEKRDNLLMISKELDKEFAALKKSEGD